MLNFQYLIREIFAEKKRVWLTTFAIAWGTLSIVCMLAVGQGMLVTMLRYMNQLGSHLLVVSPVSTSQPFMGNKSGTIVYLDEHDMQRIAGLPGVEYVTPEYSSRTRISYTTKTQFAPVSGVSVRYIALRHVHIQSGRWINATDVLNARQVIVLGNTIAAALFPKDQNPIGQEIKVGPYLFTVVGVTENNTQLTQYETPDVLLTWIPATTFKKIFSVVGVQNILVNLKPKANRALVKQQIQDLLAILHHVKYTDKTFLHIFDNEQTIQDMESFFHGIQFFLGAVGTITLLVASLGIANIMNVAVRKATAEIGIRMACGAQPFHIVTQYLLEGFIVTFFGGVLGLVLAFFGIEIANYFLKGVSLFFIKGIQLSLSFPLFFAILMVLGVVGLLAGIFPALRAARIQPVEALRHE